MGRYSTISVHNKHFKYELDPDLVFNYDNRKIEYIYKDPETLKQVKDTITAKALKITRRKVRSDFIMA
jgi:hypothetical protein